MAAHTLRGHLHALTVLVVAALWPLYLMAPTHAEEPEENDGTTAPPDVPAVERICPDVIPFDPIPDAEPKPWLAALQDFATGRGVTVAVIDTGVAQHPALNVVDGRDVIAERLGESAADITVGPFDDCDRHGTIVAGRIASIAPDVEIISIKQTTAITNNQHQDPGGNLATMIDAISIALDMGVDVINLSVVACAPDEHTAAVARQQLAAVIDRAEAQGVVVVAASGNNSPNCQPGDTIFPGAHRCAGACTLRARPPRRGLHRSICPRRPPRVSQADHRNEFRSAHHHRHCRGPQAAPSERFNRGVQAAFVPQQRSRNRLHIPRACGDLATKQHRRRRKNHPGY